MAVRIAAPAPERRACARTVAPFCAATPGVSSVEASSTTTIRSTSPGGNRSITRPIFDASLWAIDAAITRRDGRVSVT
jgi:hypothetical protein